MKFQIGAMTVGDILDRSMRLLMARLPTFYVINLIVLAPMIALQLALPLLTGQATGGVVTPEAAMFALLGVLAAFLLLLILQPIGTAAILHIIAQEFVDRSVTLGQAFAFALSRFGAVLGTSILFGLIWILGLMLCLVPGFIFWMWYVFYAQVPVVEGLSGMAALNRSKELTEGYRGRILGLILLMLVIGWVFQGAAAMLQLVLRPEEVVFTDAGPQRTFHYQNYAINVVVSQLVQILVVTFNAVCMTLAYFDLRIRKEGYDLELAAQQQAPTPS
jgi:hypothetical protein